MRKKAIKVKNISSLEIVVLLFQYFDRPPSIHDQVCIKTIHMTALRK